MSKLKVIGFGIGTSCKDYLSKYRDEYEIIALSDWDDTTHGTERYGFKIISPYEFSKYNFDKILILSTYVEQITEQLALRCDIKEEQLLIPLKHKIKGVVLPFESESTISFARKILVYFTKLTSQNQIRLFADFGTLLGLVRDGDIIPWDDDIDFSMNEEDTKKFETILLENKEDFPYSDKLNYNCSVRRDKEGNVWYFRLHFKNKNEILFEEFEIAFGVRAFIDKWSFCMRNKYISCPSEHFSKNEFLNWQNTEITVPYNYKEYLDLVYSNWRTPEEYTFGSKYGTTFQGDLDSIKIEVTEKVLF